MKLNRGQLTVEEEMRVKLDGLFEALFDRFIREEDCEFHDARMRRVMRLIHEGRSKHAALRWAVHDMIASSEFQNNYSDLLKSGII